MKWRELPDPHFAHFVCRCHELVMEYRFVHSTTWHRIDEGRSLGKPTPERRAMWRKLLLKP